MWPNPPCSSYNPMHFRPDLAWDDLEDRLIWRGSNLRMADEIPGGMPLSPITAVLGDSGVEPRADRRSPRRVPAEGGGQSDQ